MDSPDTAMYAPPCVRYSRPLAVVPARPGTVKDRASPLAGVMGETR